MATEATREYFEEHLLDREQFMIGGRDTAVVVWFSLAVLVTLFLIVSAFAGEPPITNSSDGSPSGRGSLQQSGARPR